MVSQILAAPATPARLALPHTVRAAFFLSTGPVRHQLLGIDGTTVDQALGAVTAALRPYEHPDGVRFSAAWWLATATRG